MVLLAAGSAPWLAQAADYRFGINAEVSYNESEAEVRRRYSEFLEDLGKATGNRFVFSPVYSDRVDQTILGKQVDFLLIHTHLALKAEDRHQYQMVGFTDDRKNDTVHFMVRPDSPIKSLKQIGADPISSPGRQSWATATARAALRAATPGQEPNFKVTRLSDAVPIAVDLRMAAAGITRSQKLADESVAGNKALVIYTTPRMPVNAVIAAPGVPAATVAAVRTAISAMTGSKSFDHLGFKGLRYSDEEAKRLRAFYGH